MACTPISVVVPWCNRPELGITLDRMCQLFTHYDVRLICVNMGGDMRQLVSCIPPSLPRWQCIEIGHSVFNKAQCLNIGLAHSSTRSILFLDADVILEDDDLFTAPEEPSEATYTLHHALRQQSGQPSLAAGFLRSVEHQVTFTLKNNHRIIVRTNCIDFEKGSRSGPGVVRAARKHLVSVGGLNGSLRGWGWEDLDLLCRLTYKESCTIIPTGVGIHLDHDDRTRSTVVSKQFDEVDNYQACLLNYLNNDWTGTLSEDVRSCQVTSVRQSHLGIG